MSIEGPLKFGYRVLRDEALNLRAVNNAKSLHNFVLLRRGNAKLNVPRND